MRVWVVGVFPFDSFGFEEISVKWWWGRHIYIYRHMCVVDGVRIKMKVYSGLMIME